MIGKFRTALLVGTLLGSFIVPAWAGETNNEDGGRDGSYLVVLEDNRTKERTASYEAVLEGNFLTVHYPDGDVTYKVSDMYDRRTELEASIYNNKTKSYWTVHLDDKSHIFQKGTRERMRQEMLQKQKAAQEKIAARKAARRAKKAANAEAQTVPTPTPSPSANPQE